MSKTIPIICGSVASSPSPLGVKLHNAGYKALKLDYTYIASGSDSIEQTINNVRNLPYRGLGVSMPFKQEVIEFLDEIDSSVKEIGACNTVVNTNGVLKGYNTDWIGTINAIKEVYEISNIKNALIVGSGGVARAIAYGLKQNGIKVTICSRNKVTRKQLVLDLNLESEIDLSEQDNKTFDLVVNATPEASENSPLLESTIAKCKVMLDVVFNQKETYLAKLAKKHGVAFATGWRMLLHQAFEQFRLYTKQEPPKEVMSKVLEEVLS